MFEHKLQCNVVLCYKYSHISLLEFKQFEWLLVNMYFSFPAFLLSAPPPPLRLIDDVNANPNKRQRQPALLGDHPSEYGEFVGAQENTHNTWNC